MRKSLLYTIVLLLMLAPLAAYGQGEPALTLMVYLCGSNLETDVGAASADLAEMMAHYPADGSVRVMVMPSGSKAWQSDVATAETVIYELTGDGLEPRITLPVQSMGDPASLTALLDYGYAHASAGQYALILWNHGAGPNVGLCFDERYSSDGLMDGLTLPELSAALADSPAAERKLAWIGFDACLMASAETACAVAPYADYMIASQETEPASGWSYAFLEQLAGDVSGAETGRRIIDDYFDSLPDSMASLALSCVDLRRMPAVGEAMDRLFDGLHMRLDEASYPAFASCRVNSKSLGNSTSYEYDLIDLVDLLQVYRDEGVAECGELLALLDEVIVASRSNTPYVNGLSIYYPHYGGDETLEQTASAGYAAFIADMSALRLGKPLTDWSRTSRPAAALADGLTQVTMQLTQAQANMLDSASLLIIKQMSEDDYQLVYRTNDVALTQDNMLTAVYGEQALFIVDGQGDAVSEALPYFLQGDAVVLSGRLTRNSEDVAADEEWYAFVNCYFRQDEAGRYCLAEVREITDSPTLQGKTTLRLEDYDTLSIYQGSIIPAYGEDGSLLPPAQWPNGDMIYGWWFELADVPDWRIAFLAQQDSRSRYALLQMTDTQNQVICSELLPIPNPNIAQLSVAPQTLVDNAYCRICLTGASEIRGLHPSLRLHFTCENRSSQSISVNMRMLQLDDAIVEARLSGSAVPPGEKESFEIEIDREALERTGVQTAGQLRMNLVVSRNYTEQLFEQPVVCSLNVDLHGIAPEPVQRNVLAGAEWEGLEFSLLELSLEDDRITGLLRIRNLTGEPVLLDTSWFYLNGLQCWGYLSENISALTIPPGSVYHTELKVRLQGYPNEQYRPESLRNLPQTLGMTQLHTLGVGVYHDDWSRQARVTFTLPQPLTLYTDEAARPADAWPVIYDRDGVTIRLADCTWQPDNEYQSSYRYVNLFMENETDQDVKLDVLWSERDNMPCCLVNGEQVTYVHAPLAPAAAKAMDSIWYVAGEEAEVLESMDVLLHITDGSGRADRLRVHLEAVGEMRTDGDYCILDADQLLVAAELLN